MPASSAKTGGYPNPFGMMLSLLREIAIGAITLWAGGLGNIPPGWHLCDGTAGTPDLRDKFIPAAGPTFSVGSESGRTSHQHDLTTDGHFHYRAYPPENMKRDTVYADHTDTKTDTATTDAGNNLPQYYALAYIQYLGD